METEDSATSMSVRLADGAREAPHQSQATETTLDPVPRLLAV